MPEYIDSRYEPAPWVLVLKDEGEPVGQFEYLIRRGDRWAWSRDALGKTHTLFLESWNTTVKLVKGRLLVYRAEQPAEPRTEFPGGGVRDGNAGSKPRFDLLWPKGQPYELQFLTEFAEWMRIGAEKYADRNWELFESKEALAHAEASLGRHYARFLINDKDEDHGAAIAFNVMCIKRIRYKLEGKI